MLHSARRRAAATAAGAALVLGSLVAAALPATAAGSQTSRVVTDNPADNTPQVLDGSVDAVLQIGPTMFLGGTFSRAVNSADTPTADCASATPSCSHPYLLAFNASSGTIDTSFDPQLNGPVTSLATDGTSLYVGGDFTTARGQAVARVAKLSPAGLPVGGFSTAADQIVNDVVVRGTRLYLGGAFTTVGGAIRKGLAAVDKDSGAVSEDVVVPLSGRNNGGQTLATKIDVTPDGRTLVVIGNFTAVAGRPRSQMALVDLPATGPATVRPWSTYRYPNVCSPVFDTYMHDLDVSPDGRFVVVTTTGGYVAGSLCDTTARWELTTDQVGAQPTWTDSTGGDTTYGVAVTGTVTAAGLANGVVYTGGHYRWQNNPYAGDVAGPGAVPREGLAALDAGSGLPLGWNPGRARGVGARALYVTASGLWVGSDTERVGREIHPRIAFFPATGTALLGVQVPTWPGTAYAVRGSGLLSRTVDAAGRPTGAFAPTAGFDTTGVRGAFLVGSTLYYALPDGGLYARSNVDLGTGAAGPQRSISLFDAADGSRIPFALASLSGAFYDPATSRLYYVVAGDPALHYRWFSPDSEVVGAEQFTAPSPGVDLRSAAGLTLAGSRLFYGSADGTLRSVLFARGGIAGPAVVADTDGTWTSTTLIATGPPPPAPAPASTSWSPPTFVGTVPQAAQDAVRRAVDAWHAAAAAVQLTDQDVRVEVVWSATTPAGTALGAPADTVLHSPDTGLAYPVALEEAAAHRDLNAGGPDVRLTLSADESLWSYDPAAPDPSRYDLTSAAMRALGTGLGLASSTAVTAGRDCAGSPAAVGTYGTDGAYPTVYDALLTGSVPARTGTCPGKAYQATALDLENRSPDLAAALTTRPLTWRGGGATAAGGRPPVLSSPPTFVPGSSASMLDETVYPRGSADALMTPVLDRGEVVASPGRLAPAMLKDMVTDPAAVGSPVRHYVNALYHSFLGRDADPGGLVFWTGRLARGEIDRGQLTAQLSTSQEYLQNAVTALYNDILGRGPDPGGLADWVRQLQGGLPIATVGAGFYASDEYFQSHGANVRTWVEALYHDLLGRVSDPAGKTSWVAAAQDPARGRLYVTTSFYASQETLVRRVNALYLTLLDRTSDPSGLQTWPPVVRDRGDLALAATLATSDEYYARALGVPLPRP